KPLTIVLPDLESTYDRNYHPVSESPGGAPRPGDATGEASEGSPGSGEGPYQSRDSQNDSPPPRGTGHLRGRPGSQRTRNLPVNFLRRLPHADLRMTTDLFYP